MSTELRAENKKTAVLPKVEDLRVGIVVAEWNSHITEALLQGALDVFKREGYPERQHNSAPRAGQRRAYIRGGVYD